MQHDLDPLRSTSTLRLRVRFCETDLMRIVHHGNYLTYFEAGRVDWLRQRGVDYGEWASRGLHLPVVEVQVRYRLPARFDDVLAVETRLAELRAASLRFDYRILRGGDLLTEGSTRLACIDDANRVQRFDESMLRSLTAEPLAAELLEADPLAAPGLASAP